MTTSNNKPKVLKRFSKCPDCGSTDFMMAGLGKELKEQGLISEGLEVGLTEVGGPIVDPTIKTLTTFARAARFALRDICMGCGRQVTVKIEQKDVVVGMS